VEELMNASNRLTGGMDYQDPYGLYKPHTRFIVDDMVKAHNEGKLVYCRFGKNYVVNLERQMNSLLNST
jgi:hypothetical protein